MAFARVLGERVRVSERRTWTEAAVEQRQRLRRRLHRLFLRLLPLGACASAASDARHLAQHSFASQPILPLPASPLPLLPLLLNLNLLRL